MKNKKIVEAKTFPGKILWLKFQDGLAGEFCFADYFACEKTLSKQLQDEFYFNQVSVNHDLGCIEWPNGYDPSPDILYAIVSKQKIIIEDKIVFDPALGRNAWL